MILLMYLLIAAFIAGLIGPDLYDGRNPLYAAATATLVVINALCWPLWVLHAILVAASRRR